MTVGDQPKATEKCETATKSSNCEVGFSCSQSRLLIPEAEAEAEAESEAEAKEEAEAEAEAAPITSQYLHLEIQW